MSPADPADNRRDSVPHPPRPTSTPARRGRHVRALGQHRPGGAGLRRPWAVLSGSGDRQIRRGHQGDEIHEHRRIEAGGRHRDEVCAHRREETREHLRVQIRDWRLQVRARDPCAWGGRAASGGRLSRRDRGNGRLRRRAHLARQRHDPRDGHVGDLRSLVAGAQPNAHLGQARPDPHQGRLRRRHRVAHGPQLPDRHPARRQGAGSGDRRRVLPERAVGAS